MRLLALPGLGLGRAAWAPTLSELPWPAEVHLLPGYGEPAPAAQDLHPQALARAVVASLSPAERLVVLGHSASCQVAAHVAALAPDRVAALVLVGPTTDPRAATWPRLARRWLATAGHEDPRQVPVLVRHYSRTTLRAMRRGMEVARDDRVLGALSRASVPALVVRGRHDRICPPDWAALVAGRSGPGSRAVSLPAGGHMVPLTHGPLVAEAVGGFLAGRHGASS